MTNVARALSKLVEELVVIRSSITNIINIVEILSTVSSTGVCPQCRRKTLIRFGNGYKACLSCGYDEGNYL